MQVSKIVNNLTPESLIKISQSFYRKTRNLEGKRKNTKRLERISMTAELLAEGLNKKEICKSVGVSFQTLGTYFCCIAITYENMIYNVR